MVQAHPLIILLRAYKTPTYISEYVLLNGVLWSRRLATTGTDHSCPCTLIGIKGQLSTFDHLASSSLLTVLLSPSTTFLKSSDEDKPNFLPTTTRYHPFTISG